MKRFITAAVLFLVAVSHCYADEDEDNLKSAINDAVSTASAARAAIELNARAAREEIDASEAKKISAAWDAFREARTPPDFSLTFNPIAVTEEGGSSDLTATLTKPWKTDVTIDVAYSGTAELDKDYSASGLKITIPKGETKGTLSFVGISDEEIETDETVVASVTGFTGARAAVGDDPVLTFISDDRPPPQPDTFPPALPDFDLDRPKVLWPGDVLDRISASPATWERVVKAAEGLGITPQAYADRCLSAAAIWKAGLPTVGTIVYKKTADEYRQIAIDALLGLVTKPISTAGNHYAWNHCQPVAIGYCWLHSELTDEQRGVVRATIVTALEATYVSVQLDLMWRGYNLDAGAGMTLALAVRGETDIDWVRRYWDENWWAIPPPSAKGHGGLYNREYERIWQPDGGTREGWPYLSDQASLAFARGVYESVTGDTTSLDYPWFNRVPLLLLHQAAIFEKFTSTGKPNGYRLFALPVYSYGGEYWGQAGFTYLLAAGTGNRDPQIASLSAWLLARSNYSVSTACEELIFRCLIGDPRVIPRSPEELGLPLDYTTAGTGLHYNRSGWDVDATRVFFGSGEVAVRDFPRGDVMIWTRSLPLIGSRTGLYQHHYAGDEKRSVVKLIDATGKAVTRTGGDSTPDRRILGTFRRVGDSYVAETQGFYPSNVTLARRTWTWDRVANVATVTDEIEAAAGIRPLIMWQTPLLPTINETLDGKTVTLTNGRASAAMSFSPQPAEVLIRGGETGDLWTQNYDGSLFTPEKIDNLWLNAPTRDQQILEGGYYAVYVVPSSDGTAFRITTTIQVE